MIGATERFLAEASSHANKLTEIPAKTAQRDLTDDQLDILAILSEDPKRALLFQAVQTTVKHALEEYREKWKPKNDHKKAPGPVHHKRTAT